MTFHHGRPTVICISVTMGVFAAWAIGCPVSAALVAVGDISPAAPVNGDPLTVGLNSAGYLTINNSTALTTTTGIVGDVAGSIGFATVTNRLATWNLTSLTVGKSGIGQLDVSDGAFVNVSYGSGFGNFIIGNQLAGIGTVNVSGLGTFLRMGFNSTIGGLGRALLRVEDNGFVDATDTPTTAADIFVVGSLGRIELSNGKLRAGNINSSGLVSGSGWLRSIGNFVNSGRIATGTGEHLILDAALNNSGYVEIDGGEIEFTDLMTNVTSGSELSLRNGVARFRQGVGITNTAGVIGVVQGSNDIFGLVQNQASARIVVGGESTVVFHDNVVNNGSLEIGTGSEVVNLGGLAFGAGASLSVGLSKDENEQLASGQLHIAGAADLAGSLKINLTDGYIPSEGDMFEILSAGDVSGTVTLASPPPLPGTLEWAVNVTPTSVLLSVIDPLASQPLLGDYNNDGTVNAGDYTVWRNQLGQAGTGLAADGFPDGQIDRVDYEVWRTHYGQTRGSAAAAGDSPGVPEPATIFGCCIGCALLLSAWRRRR